MLRGEKGMDSLGMHRLIDEAVKDSKFCTELRAKQGDDQRQTLEKYLGYPLPKECNIQVITEEPNEYYILLPPEDPRTCPHWSMSRYNVGKASLIVQRAARDPDLRAKLASGDDDVVREAVEAYYNADLPDDIKVKVIQLGDWDVRVVLPPAAPPIPRPATATMRWFAEGTGATCDGNDTCNRVETCDPDCAC